MEIDRNILHKYLIGDASEEENAEIIRWIDENPAHYQLLKALNIIYDATIWYQNENKQKTRPLRMRIMQIGIKSAKIAAMLAIGFLLNILIQQINNKPKMLSFYTPTGQRAELTLEDGTRVWLNANSRITYPATFNKNHRDITLQGEAYFNVTHNKHRPFIVNAEGYKIQVLGTEFNVQAYSKKEYEIDLVKGSVHVTTPNNEVADLKPGNRIFLQESRVVKGKIIHPEHFEWRSGLISFNEETLSDIFKKIELYYDVRIVTNNNDLLNCHYSGKFRVRDGIDHIMRVLQIDNHFNYKINKERNKIIIE